MSNTDLRLKKQHVHQQEKLKLHYHCFQLNWTRHEEVLEGQGYPTAGQMFQVLKCTEESLMGLNYFADCHCSEVVEAP